MTEKSKKIPNFSIATLQPPPMGNFFNVFMRLQLGEQ
jgi:hypothetical protein